MTDFETHPIGTTKRIEELEAKLRQEVKDKERVERVWRDNYAVLEAKLAKAFAEMEKVDGYLTRLQTPNAEPLNSVNCCGNKKGRGQYTAMVRNEAREYWASLGNAIATLKGQNDDS